MPLLAKDYCMSKNAKVTISMPANSGFTPIVLNIPANTQVTVKSDDAAYNTIFTLNIENRPNNTINKKGLLISSDNDISVYYEVMRSKQPRHLSLKGENALGNEFYVVSQNLFPNRPYTSSGQTQPYEHVDIVATEDNTQITITPSVDIQGGTANVPITITLTKAKLMALLQNPSQLQPALMGTHIISNKPIAVTTSDDSIEQWKFWIMGSYWRSIDSNSLLGTEYIAIKTSTTRQSCKHRFFNGH
jgi:hypothetical protein